MQIKSEIISSTNIAEAIVDYAEEKNFKLIVIGTRGKSGFKKLLLGSVASSVITYAHCPVLVVKRNYYYPRNITKAIMDRNIMILC